MWGRTLKPAETFETKSDVQALTLLNPPRLLVSLSFLLHSEKSPDVIILMLSLNRKNINCELNKWV